MKMKKFHVIVIIVAVCLTAHPFGAFAIPIAGEGSLGNSFKGSLTYNVYDSFAALQVTLAISNPTTYLGGFGFSNESVLKASMETSGNFVLSGSNGSFQVNSINTTKGGLQQQEAKFYLTVGGNNLSSLTAESFLSNFVVLFSDSSGQVIDKASVAVSEPSTMMLLGFGLLVIGVGLRKKM